MFARGAGAAHCSQPARNGDGPTNGGNCIALRNCRLHLASTAGGERAMRDGAICDRSHPRDIERAAAITV